MPDKYTFTALVAAVLILPWVFIFIYKRFFSKSSNKLYDKLKKNYNLSMNYTSEKDVSADGVYRGKKISLATATNGKESGVTTEVSVDAENNSGFYFNVVRRKTSNNLKFSKKNSMTEDDEFDENFIVETNDTERMKKIFDFNSRFKLLQAMQFGLKGEITLNGNTITYIEKGSIKDDASLMRTELILHEMCDMADALKFH